MPGTARTATYDELAEELHATRRDLADAEHERTAFATRLLCWLRDGNSVTDVGLADCGDDGAPGAWWCPDDTAVATLVQQFEQVESDAAADYAEWQSSRDR